MGDFVVWTCVLKFSLGLKLENEKVFIGILEKYTLNIEN